MSWPGYVLTLMAVVATTIVVLIVGPNFNPDGPWLQALWGQVALSIPGWMVYVIVALVAAVKRRSHPRAAGLVGVGVIGLLITSVIQSLIWVWIMGSDSLELVTSGGLSEALIYGIPTVLNQMFWLLLVVAVFVDRDVEELDVVVDDDGSA